MLSNDRPITDADIAMLRNHPAPIAITMLNRLHLTVLQQLIIRLNSKGWQELPKGQRGNRAAVIGLIILATHPQPGQSSAGLDQIQQSSFL